MGDRQVGLKRGKNDVKDYKSDGIPITDLAGTSNNYNDGMWLAND